MGKEGLDSVVGGKIDALNVETDTGVAPSPLDGRDIGGLWGVYGGLENFGEDGNDWVDCGCRGWGTLATGGGGELEMPGVCHISRIGPEWIIVRR